MSGTLAVRDWCPSVASAGLFGAIAIPTSVALLVGSTVLFHWSRPLGRPIEWWFGAPCPGSTVYSSSRRRRSAFIITENELNVIAALAIIGLRRRPNHG